ncbi:MAG TPA: ABC transporter ATP-binding protein [Chloroflexota bacterium]|nr:ABC transporter ATP-binding protein [Chloroflexota bacterium]
MSAEPLLEVRDLRTHFFTRAGVVRAVNGVSFDVGAGEVVGLVGESGCGKTVTALSILRLVDPPGRIVGGEVRFDGRDLLALNKAQLRQVRGQEIAMIFQNPIAALNPVFTIGRQLTESLRAHSRVSGAVAATRAAELLELVGIGEARRRMRQYPHQFSGGMAQRVMIAMALTCRPKLLIADEPTTALDVTIQAQVLELLRRLNRELGMAILLITHNFGVVAETCDRMIVMYAGKVAEAATTEQIFARHLHPYTEALLACIPEVDGEPQALTPLEGYPPDLTIEWRGCEFYPRCPRRFGRCQEENPDLREPHPGHAVRCLHY